MKKHISVSLFAALMLLISFNAFSQSTPLTREVGLMVGGFTNFPCNQDYLKDNFKVISLAPYVTIGKHQFYAGILYPLRANGLFSGQKLNSRPGATAGYTYYIFNKAGRENMYVNYAFQYLRFSGPIDLIGTFAYKENNEYINNVFSLGYVVYFDAQQRFGMYYSLGYIISRGSYTKNGRYFRDIETWSSNYIWNNLSTNLGFSFKLKQFDKKVPKVN